MFRTIADPAVSAGAPASAYLLHGLRDNLRSADHYRQAFAYMTDETTGHRHGIGTVPFSYTFDDRITITTGVNDRLPFRFASSSPDYADALYSPTLAAGTRTPAATAAEMQSKMIAAVGAGAPIAVLYDNDSASENSGLIIFQHTGSVTTPNPRILELHFGTGTGFATSVGPSAGFQRADRRNALSYKGESGFLDGFLEESFNLVEGGLLTTAAWVAGAFVTNRFKDLIIPTAAFQNSSINGGGSGKISDNAFTAAKIGPSRIVASSLIGTGSSHTFDFTLPTGGAARNPQVVICNRSAPGCRVDELFITAISFSGGQWHVTVKNISASSQDVGIATY